MEQFIEFIGNHLVLAGLWLLTVAAIAVYYVRTSAKSVAPQQAVMLINRSNAVIIDIRDKKEYEGGHIVDSINIPLSKLPQRISELNKYKDKPIVVVCKMGQQSGQACKTLQDEGFLQAIKLGGGLAEWTAQSLPLVQK